MRRPLPKVVHFREVDNRGGGADVEYAVLLPVGYAQAWRSDTRNIRQALATGRVIRGARHKLGPLGPRDPVTGTSTHPALRGAGVG